MKCPLCNSEIPDRSLVGPWTIYQPKIHGTKEGGEIQVCGRCYLLTSLNDSIKSIEKELEKWLPSKI